MKQRPNIRLTPSKPDLLLVMIGWCAVIAVWVVILINYNQLPEIIPIHFNGAGEVDDYGEKTTIFILPAIATILFLGLTILNKYPHKFNYPVEITEENALGHYRNATRMINVMKITIVVFLGLTAFKEIQIAEGKEETLGPRFLVMSLALILIPLILFAAKSFRLK